MTDIAPYQDPPEVEAARKAYLQARHDDAVKARRLRRVWIMKKAKAISADANTTKAVLRKENKERTPHVGSNTLNN